MAYKLLSTKRADELLDSLIFYLAVHLQNREAAAKLLDGYQNEDVVILGHYHQSENYPEKLKDDISSELL